MGVIENRAVGQAVVYPIKKSGVLMGNGFSPSEKKTLQISIEENRKALILMARR